MKHKYAALILAAGYSSRMKQFKPLLLLGETTLLERSILLFQKAGIQDICVVVGYRHRELQSLAVSHNVRTVVNSNYKQGMFSSVVVGLKTLASETEAFFVMPVDIPMVKVSTVRSILSAYAAENKKIIYPAFKGRKGHPPLIPYAFARDILNWRKTGGLNAVLKECAPDGIRIDVSDEYILFDIDTPEDYDNMLTIWQNKPLKTDE